MHVTLRCLFTFTTLDPREWTEAHVREWLTWTVNEFSLKNVDFHKFSMDGANLCALGKERFLDLAPDFVGDILWEHLEMLQKGRHPHRHNICTTMKHTSLQSVILVLIKYYYSFC